MLLKRSSYIYIFLLLRASLFFELTFPSINILGIRLVNADSVSIKNPRVKVFGKFIGPRLIKL